MALQVRSEFASALNQVCSERGIEPEIVLETIRAAILAAYRKDYGEVEGIDVNVDSKTGEVALLKGKKNVTPPGFGRIAAQTAKQVILQRIREAEKTAILTEYEKKIGTIISGLVQRVNGPIVTVNLGKTEAIMPPQEQVPHENYRPNQRLRFYVTAIKQGARGEEIIVSRADRGLVEGLFKSEVPEVASGSVEIKAIAREPGSRTKIAVSSNQPSVDPVGSCVGQKGIRVQAVISEIGDEKIDIIAYNEDPVKFIAAALSPTKDVEVILDHKKSEAVVVVSDDQLSLAIGKEGQNVRLAAKLTGWKIDIKGDIEYRQSLVEKTKKSKKSKTKTKAPTKDDSKKTKAVKNKKESKKTTIKKAKNSDTKG